MFAKVKSQVFIDALKFEWEGPWQSNFKAILKDEEGSVCSMLETSLQEQQNELTWRGLDNLPYGVYTLELSRGTDAMQMRLVKRV